MSKGHSMMITATCDACGVVRYGMVPGDIEGFDGTVTAIASSGAIATTEWYADTKGCIAEAILNRLSEVDFL